MFKKNRQQVAQFYIHRTGSRLLCKLENFTVLLIKNYCVKVLKDKYRTTWYPLTV